MAFQVPALTDFRVMFPELSAKTDAQVNLWLANADPMFNQDRWDDLLFLGMLYWTAHQLVVMTSNAGQQLIDDGVTKKVGDISKTRDAALMKLQAENPFYRTVYGQQYMFYRDQVGAAGGYAV